MLHLGFISVGFCPLYYSISNRTECFRNCTCFNL